jgi:N-ethylmaleimide reductase
VAPLYTASVSALAPLDLAYLHITGRDDVVTVGGLALANPDLVERLRLGAPLNTPDRSTF